jgi:hypothetical protein
MDDRATTPTDPALTARLTRRAAERAAERPTFMAWVLARYRDAEGVDDDQLAHFLGITREALDQLALCGRPRQDLFKEDVAAIAERFGADPHRLTNLIRQVDALGAFARAPAAGSLGVMAAARGRAAEESASYDTETDGEQADGTGDKKDGRNATGEQR